MPGHLHFTSQQPWHRSLQDALDAVQGTEKCVWVQVGRQSCGGSRAMVEKALSKDEILEYVAAHYECVSVDADRPEPRVAEMIAQMPQHERTPFCLFVGANGRLLHSTSGGRPPAVFLADLIQAQALTRV